MDIEQSELILPYVYKVTNLITNEFYIGFRQANIKKSIVPKSDLGIVYFTSGKFAVEYKKTPENFKGEILFCSGEYYLLNNKKNYIAYWYEQVIIRESIHNKKCINGWYTNPDTGEKCFCNLDATWDVVTNGIKNKHIPKNSDIPEGFRLGITLSEDRLNKMTREGHNKAVQTSLHKLNLKSEEELIDLVRNTFRLHGGVKTVQDQLGVGNCLINRYCIDLARNYDEMYRVKQVKATGHETEDELAKTIMQMVSQGIPLYKVKESLGMTPKFIKRICKKYEITADVIFWSTIVYKLNIFDKNAIQKFLINEFNCNESSITKVCKKLNICRWEFERCFNIHKEKNPAILLCKTYGLTPSKFIPKEKILEGY